MRAWAVIPVVAIVWGVAPLQVDGKWALTLITLLLLGVVHAIEYIERQHPFWGWFAGSVVSSRCGMLKPEPAIFRHLLSKFDLAPEQTFFIDDTPANVVAAEGLGMHGAVYRGTGECLEALQEAGYLSS